MNYHRNIETVDFSNSSYNVQARNKGSQNACPQNKHGDWENQKQTWPMMAEVVKKMATIEFETHQGLVRQVLVCGNVYASDVSLNFLEPRQYNALTGRLGSLYL